jgi:hypothetical protein
MPTHPAHQRNRTVMAGDIADALRELGYSSAVARGFTQAQRVIASAIANHGAPSEETWQEALTTLVRREQLAALHRAAVIEARRQIGDAAIDEVLEHRKAS